MYFPVLCCSLVWPVNGSGGQGDITNEPLKVVAMGTWTCWRALPLGYCIWTCAWTCMRYINHIEIDDNEYMINHIWDPRKWNQMKKMILTAMYTVKETAIKPTLSPGPSPRSKWRSEKPLAKAAEILQESWSILSRDTLWNGFLGGWF